MPEPIEWLIDRTDTPLGELVVATDRDGCLRIVDWTDHDDRTRAWLDRQYGAGRVKLVPTRDPHGRTSALLAYFAGDIAAIDALPAGADGTAFQRTVWRALRDIPAGQTISYGELARRIGKPAAVRAVGLANGANPIGVVVPCHRVIGANGTLTGYGGGLHRKRWLLAHEGSLAGPLLRSPDMTASLGTIAS